MLHTMLAYRCVLQVLLCSYQVSHLPCDPVYPPEVGYLGSHGLWYPVVSSTELLACATWRSAEWHVAGTTA